MRPRRPSGPPNAAYAPGGGDSRRCDVAAGDGQVERERARGADDGAVLPRRVEPLGREHAADVLRRLLGGGKAGVVEDRSEAGAELLRPAGPNLEHPENLAGTGPLAGRPQVPVRVDASVPRPLAPHPGATLRAVD